MGELSGKSVFTGEDDGIFKLGGGFDFAHAFVVFGLGLRDGTKFIFETSFDGVNVGLNPNKGWVVTGFFENCADGVSFFFGIEAAFNDDVLVGFSDEIKDFEGCLAIEIVFFFDVVDIVEWSVKLSREFFAKSSFTTTGGSEY